MSKIEISKASKSSILAALYNASKVQGMGVMQAKDGEMSESEAEELLSQKTYFDYLHGKIMKVDLSGDSFSPAMYDRDNGQGAALRAISHLV